MTTSTTRVLVCCGGMVSFGGLERMVFEGLRVLRENGIRVHCVVNDWENFRITRAAAQIGATWSEGFYRHRISRKLRNPFALLAFAVQLVVTNLQLLRDAFWFRPTHIVVPEYRLVLLNSMAFAMLRLIGVRTLLWVHNAPPQERFYGHLWKWLVSPLAGRIVCCSEHVRQEVMALGVDGGKVHRVYNTVPRRHEHFDPFRAPNGKDPFKVIYIGQVVPQKGLDLLLEAVSEIALRGYPITLDIVGRIDGWIAPEYREFRDEVIAKASTPALAEKVFFLGVRENVYELLAKATVHCIPSRPSMREGLPLVVLEAKQASTVSVAFPIAPFPEIIIHQVDGWICREVGVKALAEGIEYFISDPRRATQMGIAAHESLGRFSREEFSRDWLNEFGTVHAATCATT